ncbi:hypothetical protein [Propionibacterium freudenreichii]|nr:hypothetical protein [Propionibacterium freudenreichii]
MTARRLIALIVLGAAVVGFAPFSVQFAAVAALIIALTLSVLKESPNA